MRPFRFYNRNGIEYARFLNPETKTWTHGYSTGTGNKDEADFIAMKMLYEGIPFGKEKKPRNPKDFFTIDTLIYQLNHAPLTQEDVPRILNALKNRGFIDSARISNGDNETLIAFLLRFWDYEKSPYIQERIAHDNRITRNHAWNKTKNVEKYWKAFFKDMLLQDLTRQKIKEFHIWLSKQYKTDVAGRKLKAKLAPATMNNILKAGTIALKWASLEKIIPENPSEGLAFFSGESEKRGILLDDEVEKLFTEGNWVGNPGNRLGNMVAMQTGLRQGEIVALKVMDIRPDRLLIRSSLSTMDGLKGTKTEKPREVAILPQLAEALMNHAKQNPHKYGPDCFVFWNDNCPDNPQAGTSLYRALKTALWSIGISEEIRKKRKVDFHSWRHFYATKMTRVLDAKAAKLTGHATPEMLQLYSDHSNEKDFQEAVTATKDVFGGLWYGND